jgi:hypothetical protein
MQRSTRLLPLLALLMVSMPLPAQTPPGFITATLTWQSSRLSGLQLYAVNTCNSGPVTATVQSYRDVWPRAAEQGLYLQAPVAIKEAEASVQGTSKKAWATYLIGAGCAVVASVTNSEVVALNKDKTVGKVIAYGSSACSIGLPIWASTMSKTPGGDKAVPYDQLLPAVFILGSGDCKQSLAYAVAAGTK